MFLASLLTPVPPQIYNPCILDINFAILFNNFMIFYIVLTHNSVWKNIKHLRYFHTEALPPPLPLCHKLCRRINESFALPAYHHSILNCGLNEKRPEQTDEHHSIISVNRRPMGNTITRETVPINKHILTKHRLCRAWHKEKKNNYLHFENWRVAESPSYKDTMPQVLLKLVQWFCRRYLNFVNVFLLFHYNLPLEKGILLILTNLNPLHTRMVCAKFGWN